jgi:hypothetical protein
MYIVPQWINLRQIIIKIHFTSLHLGNLNSNHLLDWAKTCPFLGWTEHAHGLSRPPTWVSAFVMLPQTLVLWKCEAMFCHSYCTLVHSKVYTINPVRKQSSLLPTLPSGSESCWKCFRISVLAMDPHPNPRGNAAGPVSLWDPILISLVVDHLFYGLISLHHLNSVSG